MSCHRYQGDPQKLLRTAGVLLLMCILPFPDHGSQVLKDHLVQVKTLMVLEETMSSPGTSLTSLCLCSPPWPCSASPRGTWRSASRTVVSRNTHSLLLYTRIPSGILCIHYVHEKTGLALEICSILPVIYLNSVIYSGIWWSTNTTVLFVRIIWSLPHLLRPNIPLWDDPKRRRPKVEMKTS